MEDTHVHFIDASEIEDELEERKQIVARLIAHRMAPTEVPSFWKSFRLVGFMTLFMSFMTGAFGSYFLMMVTATGMPFLWWGSRKDREQLRKLSGTHADCWEAFQKEVEKHLDDVEAFNTLVSALENPDHVIETDLRERLVASLTKEHARLTAAGKRLFTDGFDLPFDPCVYDLAATVGGVTERMLKREIQMALLVEYISETEGNATVRRFLDVQKHVRPVILPDPDDLVDRFAALDAADRSKPL